jgi:hypothetical protein
METKKESWQTFEEASGQVRPERVNKWPNSMRDRWWWWWWKQKLFLTSHLQGSNYNKIIIFECYTLLLLLSQISWRWNETHSESSNCVTIFTFKNNKNVSHTPQFNKWHYILLYIMNLRRTVVRPFIQNIKNYLLKCNKRTPKPYTNMV